jgi:hypothetical protein
MGNKSHTNTHLPRATRITTCHEPPKVEFATHPVEDPLEVVEGEFKSDGTRHRKQVQHLRQDTQPKRDDRKHTHVHNIGA